MHGSPAGPSLEKKGLRFDAKVLRAEGQAEPPWAMLSCRGWSLRQHCICAQSDREVHRATTSDGISGGQPNRVQPRRSAQKKTTSQFTSSCFGLVHGHSTPRERPCRFRQRIERRYTNTFVFAFLRPSFGCDEPASEMQRSFRPPHKALLFAEFRNRLSNIAQLDLIRCLLAKVMLVRTSASFSPPRSMPQFVSECRYRSILRGAFRVAQSQP